MSKKIVIALVLLLALLMAVWLIVGRNKQSDQAGPDAARHTQEVGAASAGTSAQASESAPTPAEITSEEVADSEDQEPLELAGRDFTVLVSPNGNPKYLDVSITVGTEPVRESVDLDGKSHALDNVVFDRDDRFELKSLLPEAEREQIIVRGSTWIPRGYGGLNTYTVYKVEPKRILMLPSLVTGRDFEGEEGQTSRQLKATVQERTEEGRLEIEYRYEADGAPEQTLVFRWDGERFVDMSGRYAEIEATYRP